MANALSETQRHSQRRQQTTHWTNGTITMATGESKHSKTVSEDAFPRL